MFGYLTAFQDRLSEEDQRIYQAGYCGLCRELGKKYGPKSQLVLRYDLVFLAILYSGLYETPENLTSGICLFKGKDAVFLHSEQLSYAADMNLLLAYQNLSDKVYDSKNLSAQLGVKLLKKDYEEIAGKYPRQAAAVERYMEQLHEAEERMEENPDYCANLTGEMCAEVFLQKEDEFSTCLRNMFFYLGKFIYLADAYEDLSDDLKENAYNPYRTLSDSEDFDDRVREHIESVLSACASYFEMLPIFRHRDILRNILYSGVWLSVEKTRRTRERN